MLLKVVIVSICGFVFVSIRYHGILWKFWIKCWIWCRFFFEFIVTLFSSNFWNIRYSSGLYFELIDVVTVSTNYISNIQIRIENFLKTAIQSSFLARPEAKCQYILKVKNCEVTHATVSNWVNILKISELLDNSGNC